MFKDIHEGIAKFKKWVILILLMGSKKKICFLIDEFFFIIKLDIYIEEKK
jgi:hypothetical protein